MYKAEALHLLAERELRLQIENERLRLVLAKIKVDMQPGGNFGKDMQVVQLSVDVARLTAALEKEQSDNAQLCALVEKLHGDVEVEEAKCAMMETKLEKLLEDSGDSGITGSSGGSGGSGGYALHETASSRNISRPDDDYDGGGDEIMVQMARLEARLEASSPRSLKALSTSPKSPPRNDELILAVTKRRNEELVVEVAKLRELLRETTTLHNGVIHAEEELVRLQHKAEML